VAEHLARAVARYLVPAALEAISRGRPPSVARSDDDTRRIQESIPGVVTGEHDVPVPHVLREYALSPTGNAEL
jgi:hypothetical protein